MTMAQRSPWHPTLQQAGSTKSKSGSWQEGWLPRCVAPTLQQAPSFIIITIHVSDCLAAVKARECPGSPSATWRQKGELT